MDAFSVLEKSYYVNVNDDETKFIDKMFCNTVNTLSASDKMLNYSVSAIYTATAVLQEVMRRKGIKYTDAQLEMLCKGVTAVQEKGIPFIDKTEKELDEILFGLLTDGIDLESRKKSGTERTPEEIISYMLDIIGYDENSSILNSIVDPACGTGTFVKQILNRFINGVYKGHFTNIVKELLLNKKMIRAYDTKPSNVYVTKIVMVSTLIRRNLLSDIADVLKLMSELPVYCDDFLKIKEKADFVIGNPPYIRLQNMPVEYREFIKKNFVSATGRFDIFTCFMENADKSLMKGGRMCLITSNKYLTANYGIGIRQYLSKKGHVRKIVDLYDTKFFGAAVLPAIIVCENMKLENCDVDYIGVKTTVQEPQHHCADTDELFKYIEQEMNFSKSYVLYGSEDNNVFEISRSKVKIPPDGKAWNFSSREENMIKSKMDEEKLCSLQDIFDVSVGIKTTADSVFVKPMTEKFVIENEFEREVVYPLIQSFDVSRWKISWGNSVRDRYILYPHREIEGNMAAIPLEDIPKTKRYLEECSEILKKRSYLVESKSRKWYECWVPQKLSKFKKTKLVTRDIVSQNSFALDESGKLCQGNTFFLTKKKSVFSIAYADLSEHQYYCFMLGIMNSKALEYYQKMISGCLYSKKYRYTTSNLNRWPIPRVSKSDAIKIAGYVDELIAAKEPIMEIEEEIDKIVYKAFYLTDEMIMKIEAFICSDRKEKC